MAIFLTNKLIRDNIYKVLEEPGFKASYEALSQEGFIAALKEKLIEEAKEVQAAHSIDDLIMELADVLEVIGAICREKQISPSDLRTVQEKKRKDKGGFSTKKRCLAFEVCENIPDNQHWIDYFRSRYDDYPEVKSLDIRRDCALSGFNHITLAVNDLNSSFNFYHDILHFRPLYRWSQGAYFLVGDDWFCISQSLETIEPAKIGYSHLAFTLKEEDFEYIEADLNNKKVKKWQDNESEGKSLYILDPNGYQLELHVGNWQSRLQAKVKEELNDSKFFVTMD